MRSSGKLKLMSALLLIWLCLPVGSYAAQTDQLEFQLNPESWTGVKDTSGINVYKGIPFAAPPTGENRWRPPQPYQLEARKHLADKFPAACMQGPHIENWYRDLVQSLGKDPSVIESPEGGYSEDCLYLNIWSKKRDAKMPVMVWIHGGSNKGGWSYEPNYDGHKLALGNVVVVSLAYRLGIFGNFSHPELIGEQGGTAGNYGLLDLIAALEWIQKHIHDFGGDPDNVTIFGESAGAANIGYLMSSASARGLFHKAIHQSGGFQQHGSETLEQLTRTGKALSGHLGDSDLRSLRALHQDELLKAVEKYMPGLGFGSVVGGHGLASMPHEVFRSLEQADVPLMIGTNAHEWLMYVGDSKLEDYLRDYGLEQKKSEVETHLASLDLPSKLDRIATAYEMFCPSIEMAKFVSEVQTAYVYQLTRVREGSHWQSVGAYHGAEIPYVFDTHDDWLATGETDLELTRLMQQYWLNFARSGNPNRKGLPHWREYRPQSRQVIDLNIPVKMKTADETLCRLMGY
jgi:para-nitrobenzyl esterase